MADVKVTNGVAEREMITFLVGTQEFCVDVMVVREIRVWTPATPVAHSPDFMCGVINLRGLVIPIIDFAVRLGFPAAVPTSRHAILVVQVHDQLFGLLVEGVSEILTIGQAMLQPTPDIATKASKEFVTDLIAIDGRMISLIAIDAFLPSTKMADQVAA